MLRLKTDLEVTFLSAMGIYFNIEQLTVVFQFMKKQFKSLFMKEDNDLISHIRKY